MNLFLHGMAAGDNPIAIGADSLAESAGERFSVVLTNPPFGRKSTIGVTTGPEANDRQYRRREFVAPTNNKQLNFVQHARTLIADTGRCAIVVPDNVLFEGGAGESVRRELLTTCNVHTLLRLPVGIFYAQGVKANVLFFDAQPATARRATERLWVYDLRTGLRYSHKTRPLAPSDLEEFVGCFQGTPRNGQRSATWSALDNPGGRWRSFDGSELLDRDKANLDITWLTANGRADEGEPPEMLAEQIVGELREALQKFEMVARRLKRR